MFQLWIFTCLTESCPQGGCRDCSQLTWTQSRNNFQVMFDFVQPVSGWIFASLHNWRAGSNRKSVFLSRIDVEVGEAWLVSQQSQDGSFLGCTQYIPSITFRMLGQPIGSVKKKHHKRMTEHKCCISNNTQNMTTPKTILGIYQISVTIIPPYYYKIAIETHWILTKFTHLLTLLCVRHFHEAYYEPIKTLHLFIS